MTLENILRGSGDIGAMLATCWGICQIEAAQNRIYVQNVKARDFLPCEPFIIQGRLSIDQSGYFALTDPPGFAGSFSEAKPQAGRRESFDKAEKIAQIKRMLSEGKSYEEIASALGISKGTISKWLK